MWKEKIQAPPMERASSGFKEERVWEEHVAEETQKEAQMREKARSENVWDENIPGSSKSAADFRREALVRLAPRSAPVEEPRSIEYIEPTEELRAAMREKGPRTETVESAEIPSMLDQIRHDLSEAVQAKDTEKVAKLREQFKELFMLNRALASNTNITMSEEA